MNNNNSNNLNIFRQECCFSFKIKLLTMQVDTDCGEISDKKCKMM